MGVWGVYDDENDYVADVWGNIIDAILPKKIKEVDKYLEGDWDTKWKIRNAYALENQDKLFSQIERWIMKFKRENMKRYGEDENPYMNIVGVCLRGIRYVGELPVSDPLSSGIFNSGIPSKLPRGFPESLRKEALSAVRKEIEIDQQGWKGQKSRDNALQHELFLFSKGKEGMEGVHLKPRKEKGSKEKGSKKTNVILCKKGSRKGCRKISRKGSRKISRKGSRGNSRKASKGSKRGSKKYSRKGPNISATAVKMGTSRRGNDGDMWVVKEYDTKYGAVPRWVKKN